MSAESELAFLRSLPPEVIRLLRLVRIVFGPGARLVKMSGKAISLYWPLCFIVIYHFSRSHREFPVEESAITLNNNSAKPHIFMTKPTLNVA